MNFAATAAAVVEVAINLTERAAYVTEPNT